MLQSLPAGLLSMVLVLPSAHAGSYDLHRILETQGKCELNSHYHMHAHFVQLCVFTYVPATVDPTSE